MYERGDGSWLQSAKLFGSENDLGDLFGTAIAADGDRVAISARQANPGNVHVFDRDGNGDWIQQPGALESRGISDLYGESLALRDDLIVVGAEWDGEAGNRAGAVYVYELVGGAWLEKAKLAGC